MKTIHYFLRLPVAAVMAFCLAFAAGCGDDPKDDPAKAPVLTTVGASAIAGASAVSGGNITDDGGAEVTARGVCWSTVSNPTVADAKTSDGKGTGGFTSNISGLAADTKYYVRAYATNSAGTAYGNEVSFTTQTTAPAVTTAAVKDITATSATAGGEITAAGAPAYTERGVCYATAINPTTAGSKIAVAGTGTGAFTANLTGLTAGTKYYVRAYAVGSGGTVYGNEVNFTASTTAPVLTTAAVSGITATGATAGGNITDAGAPAFTERGVCYAVTTNPTTAGSKVAVAGTGTGAFTAALSGLTANTKYYVRAYAVAGTETTYGNEVNFTTAAAEEPIGADSELLLETIYRHSETKEAEAMESYEYDSQGRIVKISNLHNNADNYETITYDDATGVVTLQGVEYNGPFKDTYTKSGNTIVVKNDKGELGSFTLNDQGLPTELKDGENKITFTYDSKGNLQTVTGFYEDGAVTTFTYDAKKGPFYSCTSPKWYLWLNALGGNELGGYINNMLTESSTHGSRTYTYEYNAAGYPTRVSFGADFYYTFKYRKK